MKELSYFEEQCHMAVKARDQMRMRFAACLLLSAVFFGLTLLSLPRIAAAILQMVFCVLIWGVCRREFSDGIRSFLKLSPSQDTFSALALLAQFGFSIRLLVSESPVPPSSAAVLFLSVSMAMLMKYLYLQQIVSNLDLIRDKTVYGLQVADLSLSKKYISQVCSVNPVLDFPNVIRTTFDSDPAEKRNRRLIPLVALAVLIASAGLAVFQKGMFWASFATLLVVCTPFTAEASFVLPYCFLQRMLRRSGSILLGNYSVEQLKNTDTLLIKDSDLFPPEKNEVVHFHILKKAHTADIIEYITALLRISESPLSDAFRRAVPSLPDRKPNILQWRVIKNYGIVATINMDNVLWGNRNLLLSHNIQPWSSEKEAMLTAAGVHLMYLTINGEIAATLIFRYGEDPELKKSAALLNGEFHILVETRDCNINESLIQRRYELTHAKISVPDPDEMEAVNETRAGLEEDSRPPAMLSTRNALGIMESIRRVKNLGSVLRFTVSIQQFSLLFGLILTVIGLILSPGAVGWLWLLLYHLLWLLPVPIVYLLYK